MSQLTTRLRDQIVALAPKGQKGMVKNRLKELAALRLTPAQEANLVRFLAAAVESLPGLPSWIVAIIELLVAGLPK
jgi:hypothetical protein